MAKGKKRKAAPGDVATNRRASFRYNLLERFECGIVLTGTEVKSLRDAGGQLKDSYAVIRDGEMWLVGMYIAPYGPASRENHDPDRTRKLLLHRREIDRLTGRTQERGLTLVPTRVYFSGPRPGPRSRSRSPRARTSSTSASRFATARLVATSSASCARRAGSARQSGGRAPVPVERLGEVGPQVLDILQPDAQPEQSGRHAVALPTGARLERRGDAAEARRVLDQAQRALDGPRGLAVGDVEGEERAEGLDVAGGDRVVEPRVADSADGRMGREPLCELERGFRLAAAAERERLQPTEGEPGGVGRGGEPGRGAEGVEACVVVLRRRI